MADISSYLAQILAAVYGEDVRGSIHDAIELINNVSEVVLTTGNAVTGPTSSSIGFYEDSLYLNTTTYELWKCVGTNSWTSQGIIKGSNGNGIASIVKTSTVGLVDTYTITLDDGTTQTFNVTNGADGTDGSVWYKGTALTGTSTSITGFGGKQNDFYLNSTTGNVYICTSTGGASAPGAATWDYVMTLSGGGGSSVTVIDNLTSTSSTDALSANQGRVLKGLVDSKASNTQTFTQASTRANLVSGETLSTLFGKLMKWYTDLKSVAFSGSYTDLSDKPTIPTVNDATLTIQQNGTSKGTFTANANANATVNITTPNVYKTQQSLDGTTVTFNNCDLTKHYDLEADLGTSWSGPTPSYTGTYITNVVGSVGSIGYTLQNAVIGQSFNLIDLGI